MDDTAATLTMVESLIGVATADSAGDRIDGAPTLRSAADEMRRVARTANTIETLQQQLAACIQNRAALDVLLHYQSDETRPLEKWLRPMGLDESLPPQAVLSGLMDVCAISCSRNRSQVRNSVHGVAGPTVAVPLATGNQATEALCATLGRSTQSLEEIAGLLQLAGAQIAVWHSRQAADQAEYESQTWTAILELVGDLETSEEVKIGCQSLANRAQSFLRCQRVAVGLCKEHSKHCRLQALSGISGFDKHAEPVTAIEAALDETLLKGDMVDWPATDANCRQVARAHEQLRAALGADRLISAPFYDSAGLAAGAWLFVDPPPQGRTEVFVRAAQLPVGACLRWLQRSRGGLLSRARRRALGKSPKRNLVIASAVIIAVAAVLAWPRPHKIGCDCQLQPVVRQYIAAPYQGTLADTFVKAGDVVRQGDVLAVMDGREIRLELAAVTAEYGRAKKMWESSLSADEFHEAQQAKLDMKRLEYKRELLRQRQEHLQIKSPLRGAVVRGDLEKSKGAPLSVGQSLFEIAPLDRMNLEIVVPEEEISFIESGMEVKIRLEAYPRKILTSKVSRIVPQAEINHDQFVFIAEAELENATETLRPGMNGRATVIGSRKTTAWILFHKPYESMLMLLGI
jgi:multidrug resistance efflux pump